MSRKMRASIYAVLCITILLLLVGCDRHSDPSRDSSPEEEGLAELTVGMAGWGDLNTLDPVRAGVAAPILVIWHTHERLVGIDPIGRAIPMLASSWKSSDDLKEWRFLLRSDARFHGARGETSTPLTSGDVKASIERALRIPGFAQSLLGDLVLGAEDFIAGKVSTIRGLEASNNEIVFRLSRPFAFLPERLASSFLSIVPKDTPDESSEPPRGSGPYRLVSWDRTSNRVVLEKTRHAWDPPSAASPRRIVLHIFANEGTAIEELFAGTLDWLETTSTALPLLRSRKDRTIAVRTPAHSSIRLVALNVEHTPFREGPQVGLALNYATDRQAIVRALGGGNPVSGPVPGEAGQGGGLDYNLDKARDIVRTLVKGSRRLELLVQPGSESQIIAETLERQWARAGFEVVLRPGLADFFDRVVQGNYQLALGYYGPFIPSAEQYLLLYREQAKPVPNVMRYSSALFERAFESYTAATSPEVQRARLGEALSAIVQNPPTVWLVRAPPGSSDSCRS